MVCDAVSQHEGSDDLVHSRMMSGNAALEFY